MTKSSRYWVDFIVSLKKKNQIYTPIIFGIDAADALERIGGKGPSGAYSEHMMSLVELAVMFSSHINENDPTKSQGLTEQTAEQFLAQYGPNTLTPPPKVPLWLLFLIQFTNLLMVSSNPL